MSYNRTEEILSIIREQPGFTAADIRGVLLGRWHLRAWLGQRIRPDSILAEVFGPSFAGIWISLDRLTTFGAIYGAWFNGSQHYYSVPVVFGRWVGGGGNVIITYGGGGGGGTTTGQGQHP